MPHRMPWKFTLAPLCLVYLTSLIVVAGVAFGASFLMRQGHPHLNPPGFVQAFGSWDGVWYQRIVANGYSYDEHQPSSVAYFPLLPKLASVLRWSLGSSSLATLLLVNYFAFVAAVLCASKVASDVQESSVGEHTILCLLLWPMSIFLRFTYTESLFLLFTVAFCLGLRRSWPLCLLALIGGLASATRAVGIAFLLPLAWECWRRSHSVPGFLIRMLVVTPLACSGLLAYMAFLHIEFGDALAFAKTQVHWGMRPDLSWQDKVVSLISLEPIWSIYWPSAGAFWPRHEVVESPVFSLQFWNPIYFLTCGGLVVYGVRKRWLLPAEWMLALGLLGIPYVMQSYRMMMLGHGRFTCVVFPMFLVLGRIMAGFPTTVSSVLYVLMAVQLFYWSALFAAWHRVF